MRGHHGKTRNNMDVSESLQSIVITLFFHIVVLRKVC